MKEIFKPSLVVTLGTNAKKTAWITHEKLMYLPQPFLDLIDYYEALDVECIQKDLQNIVDDRLLNGQYVNALVNMGYKLRNENISEVKINIYFVWDVFNSEVSALEVIKILKEIKYGNIHKQQHSGASLFILPIMEKQWMQDEKNVTDAIDALSSILKFISEENTVLELESKIYLLNSISEDGIRIPAPELIYIASMLLLTNIIPSKDPPLSHYSSRLLMHEGKYKLGTVGIAGMTFEKEKLADEFSRYAVVDLLKYASEYEVNICFEEYISFDLIEKFSEKEFWINNINLYNIEKLEEKIESKLEINIRNIEEAIKEEMDKTIFKYNFKMAVNYLNELKKCVNINRAKEKTHISIKVEKKKASVIDKFFKLTGNKKYYITEKQRLDKEGEKEALVNHLLDQCIEEYFKAILNYVEKKEEIIFKCIRSFKETAFLIEPKREEELAIDNLFSNLLNFKERKDYYYKRKIEVYPLYKTLVNEMLNQEYLGKEKFEDILILKAREECKEFILTDFNELLRFKFGGKLNEEFEKWINIALIKSRYLLQSVGEENLEEHAFFISSMEVYDQIRDVVDHKLKDFNISSSDEYDSDSVFLIRICLGIDINTFMIG